MHSFALVSAALVAILPAVQGHMAIWDESVYGFSDDYSNVPPLSGLGFNQWWFHNKLNDEPSATKTLVPGENVMFQIACSKAHTTFKGKTTSDACPNDSGAYHAGGKTGTASGWDGNNEASLMGCALAIAYKSDASQVKPEDFIVFSVQERCVRQRDTSFAVPSNMPACPSGGCTCAWFWQGKNSANEMYMNGFKCDVQGGTDGPIPQPKEPRRGEISGPTQPMYWANDVNNVGYEPQWENKPSYNSAWGWTNGAQTGAFGAGGGNSNPVNTTRTSGATGPTSSVDESAPEPSTTSSRRRRPRPTDSDADARPTDSDANSSPTWPVLKADPSVTSSAKQPAGTAGTEVGKCTKRRKRAHDKRARGHARRSRI